MLMIILIVVIGIYGISINHNGIFAIVGASNVTYLNYTNSTYGIKFEYPSNWQISYNQTNLNNYGTFALFNNFNTSGGMAMVFSLSTKNISSTNISLANFSKENIQFIENNNSFENMKSLSMNNTTISGLPAIEFVYTSTISGSLFETLNFYIINNKREYLFSYTTLQDQYNEFIPEIQHIITSMVFIN